MDRLESDPQILSIEEAIRVLNCKMAEAIQTAATSKSKAASANAWHEFREMAQELAKLTKSEWQRMLAARVMISPEEDAVFRATLLESIKRHVRDPAILGALARDLAGLLD